MLSIRSLLVAMAGILALFNSLVYPFSGVSAQVTVNVDYNDVTPRSIGESSDFAPLRAHPKGQSSLCPAAKDMISTLTWPNSVESLIFMYLGLHIGIVITGLQE